jgi:hypothetical protein
MLKNYQEMRVFFGLYYAFLSATALYLDWVIGSTIFM